MNSAIPEERRKAHTPAASILIINPNTSAGVSRIIGTSAARWSRACDRLHVLTAATGNAYIGTVEAMATAQDAALATAQQWLHGGNAPVDALVVGCFADIAVNDMRLRYDIPCMSLLGASLRQARGARYSIVTAGAQWQTLLPDMLRGTDDPRHAANLCSIRTFEASIDDVEQRPQATRARLQGLVDACLSDDGAQKVIVGGAALGGLLGNAGEAVIDCVEAAVRWALCCTQRHGSAT